jgi:hypothetical protein
MVAYIKKRHAVIFFARILLLLFVDPAFCSFVFNSEIHFVSAWPIAAGNGDI